MQLQKSIVTKEGFLFFLIIIFAAALYLFNINYSEIWNDESFTKSLVRHPFPQFFKLMSGDFHPPLYYVALKLFTSIVGLNDFTIRLFSVIGALCTIILGYVVGQKVLGKSGALYYSLLLLAMPITAFYSHNARMYTWSAFTITGVFLYACLFVKTEKKSDLILLGIFSLMAAYTHYYSLIAAFMADLSVLVYLFMSKKKSWRAALAMGIGVFILYLPWVSMLLCQTRTAQKDFWIPEVSFSTLASCYISPFGQQYQFFYTSYPLAVIIYGLTLFVIYKTFIAVKNNDKKDNYKFPMWLSLVIFNLTILMAIVLSFAVRPILYTRYIVCISTMVMVPPSLYFMSNGYKWLKAIFMVAILCCGVYISVAGSYFSFGPYKQSLEYLQKTHPDIIKIVHTIELTAGPFVEYDVDRHWKQYYLKTDDSAWYTNMDAYDDLQAIKSLDEILKKDDVFCLASFPLLPLNANNHDLILSQCQILSEDKVADNRQNSGTVFSLYILRYRGK
jgi:4-amino-4-deoxy-L-arabinose transferase-like glycosyltransferase